MKILLTNDDGIASPGISALARRFSSEHEVYVVAPSSNRSGASSSINVGVPLELKKVESLQLPSKLAYALSGSPVDCALCGINGEHIPNVDVVISGINDGPNIGTDIIFSGTCGAARYACFMGIPGIALSVDCNSFRDEKDTSNDLYYDSLADWTFKNLNKLIELCGKKRLVGNRYIYEYFVNVNSPCLKNYKGVKFTSPCVRRYYDEIVIEKKSENSMLSKCVGEQGVFSHGDEVADYIATENGYLSVSSVYAEVYAKDLRGMENSFIL